MNKHTGKIAMAAILAAGVAYAAITREQATEGAVALKTALPEINAAAVYTTTLEREARELEAELADYLVAVYTEGITPEQTAELHKKLTALQSRVAEWPETRARIDATIEAAAPVLSDLIQATQPE